MSNLDLVQQETVSRNIHHVHTDLPIINEKSLNHMDMDLIEAWRTVFEEDKVQVIEGCK